MLLVHMGRPEAGEQFLAKRWPEARAVSDPKKRLYDAFGLTRGSMAQLMGPSVWAAGVRSLRHGVGRPVGDPFVLGGSFIVHGADVIAADVAETSASLPDLDRLAAAAHAVA
ncbi:MAG: AhpC/TSA family protein [Planctomycetota bacterium]